MLRCDGRPAIWSRQCLRRCRHNSVCARIPRYYSELFFAPDCGTTAGTWTDNDGFPWSLKGGDSSGTTKAFTGTVDTGSGYFGCGIWDVAGTRTGQTIDFTATDRGSRCAASATFTGGFIDCNKAIGSWTNSYGSSGSWSWSRTNTVGGQAVSVRPNASPNWTRGPANEAFPQSFVKLAVPRQAAARIALLWGL